MKRIASLALAAGISSVGVFGLTTSTAFAASSTSGCYTGCLGSNGGGTTQATDPTPTANPTTTSASSGTGSLAFTGADIAGTITIGAVLIGGGIVAVGASRRRRHA